MSKRIRLNSKSPSRFNELPGEMFGEIVGFIRDFHDILSLIHVTKYLSDVFHNCEYIISRTTHIQFYQKKKITNTIPYFVRNVRLKPGKKLDIQLQFLTGIHTLNMSYCIQITDKAFENLKGIHRLIK